MTFWSGEKLLEYVDALEIVRPYNENKIDCSAYTLTVGPEAFVTPDFSMSPRDNLKKTLAPAQEEYLNGQSMRMLGGEVVIPAGQFAYLLTEEYVRIPTCAMGFISLKFSVKELGLINVSGFHVDPGFQGRLIFSVYNAGPEKIHLNRGQDVFLMWLADLDRASKLPFVKGFTRDLQRSISPKMISAADKPIHSMQQLSEKIEKLANELKLFKRIAGAIMTIIATAISLAALIFAAARFWSEDLLGNTFN